jgi:hypothetical protein
MLEKVREKISARAEVQDNKNKFRVKRTSGAGEIRALSKAWKVPDDVRSFLETTWAGGNLDNNARGADVDRADVCVTAEKLGNFERYVAPRGFDDDLLVFETLSMEIVALGDSFRRRSQ